MKNPFGIILFGKHLRNLRQERNWSQQELADTANLAKTTIQRIENAKFIVSLDVLISISEALQIPLKVLVDFPINQPDAIHTH